MPGKRPALAVIAALSVALSGLAGLLLGSAGAEAATITLCHEQTASVADGRYTVASNEFGSGARECITTAGKAMFAVADSAIVNAANGPPGAYPSIYQGCHWGRCSSGLLAATPVRVSSLNAGRVTTSWSTKQPGGSSAYDVAYDIWFNKTPATSGQPNCAEMMVWLNHNGGVRPFGSQVASSATIGGHAYNVWEGQQPTWKTITYDMTAPAASVSRLDVGTLARDAVSRGFLPRSCYLIDVEAGFELWRGGDGLATRSFSVRVADGTAHAATPVRGARNRQCPAGRPFGE